MKIFPLPSLLLCIFFMSPNQNVQGQEKLNLAVGIGFPELINAGLRYQLGQTQLGLSFGVAGESTAISGDVFYHFGGRSELSYRRPWYFRTGLTYERVETSDWISNAVWISPRIGRDFNLSERIGIAADLGAAFQLSYEEIRKEPGEAWNWPIFPSFSLSLFFRL